MAQPSQLVIFALLIVELACVTIASHPPSWRRQPHVRSANTMVDTEQVGENPGDDSQELQSDESHGSQQPVQAQAGTASGTDTTTPELSSCPTCWMQEQQKQFRIDSIKRQILKKLKLSHVPNVTGPPPAKNPALRVMINDYPGLSQYPTMQSDAPLVEAVDDSQANLERILIFAKRPTHTYDPDASECCYFNVAKKTAGYQVTSAKLYFYVSAAKVIQTTIHQMVIKMITAPANHAGNAKLRTVAVIKVQLSPRTGEWRSVDFTNVVQGWAAEPETNMGILLELYDDGGNSVVVTETSPEEPKRPFLQLRLEDARRRRMKRQTGGMCSEDDQERECCLYPLIVDFEQFGWDWIIAPKQYQANYCFGSCPNHYLYQYPHTQLISQMERMAVAGPCCSPSQMRSISLLMFDEEYDIIYAEIPDMAVEQCACS